jgi:lantibiotic modifying enzyme
VSPAVLDLDLARDLARETLDGLLADGRPGPGATTHWSRVDARGAQVAPDAWWYHGTAGVALVLVRGFEVLGEARWLEAAFRGARWLLQVREGRRGPLPGLWLGEAGVAATLLAIAGATGESGWVELAAERAAWAAARPVEATDLLYGAPGVGTVCLDLLARTGERAWLERATAQAEALARAAVQDARGARWAWEGARYVGLAHGAAGVAPFLLGLARHAPDGSRWGALGEAALSFVAGQAAGEGDAVAWPVAERAPEDEPSVQWCHGAPGVSLAFARAHALTADAGQLAWATRAARATLAAGDVRRNPSLCHGLAGNADAPLELLRVTGDEAWRDAARALLAPLPGYAIRDEGQTRWASDDPGVVRPGLATGSAGVAYALLRLLAPERVPAVSP